MTLGPAGRGPGAEVPACGPSALLRMGGLAVSLALSAWPAQAWREAATYLGLTAEQVSGLRLLQDAHQRTLADLRAEEASLGQGDTSARAALCTRSRQRQADWRAQVQGLLQPAQRQRLHELEQAFVRMPAVESAQSAGLLPDRLDAAPAGFPQGQVSAEVTWQRVPAPALPGCPATAATVRPGIEPARDPIAPGPR